MATPVQSKSVLVSGVASGSLALNSAATIGNLIVLTASWLDTPHGGATETLSVPTDANGTWSVAVNPVAAFNAINQVVNGASIFYEQVVSATTHNSTVSPPSGGASNLFALITISEWPAASFDVAQSNLNNSAASITSMNSGTTAGLASATDFAVACVTASATTGLTNAGISDPATGYTASLGVSQDDATTVAAEASYLSSTGTTAGQQAVWGCTNDASMLCYQGAIAIFTPSGGGGGPILLGQACLMRRSRWD